jgi:hypothetical protein
MAAAPISQLPKSERQALLDDLNYLNTSEIKTFCKQHGIPYSIFIETKEGSRRKTPEDDRKGVMLERVRHFLETGVVLPETCFSARVVCFDPLPEEIGAEGRLFYGQYEKGNRNLVALLKDLTDGHYRDGAIARILMREFWSKGKAPTFREFAAAWLKASREHTAPNPEWAFLSDRARNTAGRDWKKMRAQKAARVMNILERIGSGR